MFRIFFLEYIKNKIYLNEDQFIDVVNKFRVINRLFYHNKIVDNDYQHIEAKYG